MRRPVILLSLLLAASMACSLVLLIELQQERDLRVALQAAVDGQRTDLLPTTRTAAPLPQAADAAAATTPAAAPVMETGSSPAPDEWQQHWQQEQRLLQDPAYREAWRAQRRTHLALRRDHFTRLLGFTSEEADAIDDLSIDRELLLQSRRMPANEADGLAQSERIEQGLAQIEDKMRAVLGPQRYERLEQFLASSGSRRRVDELRNSLPASDRLDDSQTEQLIATLHAQQMQFRKEVEERMLDLQKVEDRESLARQASEFHTQRMQAAHERLIPAAAAFLTPTQLEKFEDMMKRERLNNEAYQAMSRLQLQMYLREPAD